MSEKQQEAYVEEKANEMAQSCGFVSQLELNGAKDFIRIIIKDCQPKVSREKWKKFSDEMDGEMPSDYYVGVNRVFEWLKEIVGMEVE